MIQAGVVKRLLPVLVLATLVAAFFALDLERYLTLSALRENDAVLQAFLARHPVLAPAMYMAIYAAVVALSLPGGAVMTVGGGFLFGLWTGALFADIGATVGATIIFLLARYVVGDLVRERAGPFLKRTANGFAHNAFPYLLFLRLVPLFPFWAVNLVPALAGIDLRTYVAGTVIGIVPGTLAYASIGSGLGLYFQAGVNVPLASVFS
ncbi:MAG: TVP38/TMEM64 family protein, partial [Stellaceae bacterium]